MTPESNSQVILPQPAPVKTETAEQKRKLELQEAELVNRVWITWAIWILLSVGLIFVLFPGPIGSELLRQPNGTLESNPVKAVEAALTVRLLGFMMFGAGLVERIVLEIAKLRLSR